MADPIPFALPAPNDPTFGDDDEIEVMADGSVTIGHDPEETIDPADHEFNSTNLVNQIDQNELLLIGRQVLKGYEDDKSSRSAWLEKYKTGLKTVLPEGIHTSSDDPATSGLSKVHHPMVFEAAVQFQARALQQVLPSGGPVNAIVLGESTLELEERAERVREFMNYQITEQMEEYFQNTDQMLLHLPLTGQTFRKVYYDATLGRNVSLFVPAEDFVISNGAKSLATALRYTHVLQMNKNEFRRRVVAGFYENVPADTSTMDLESQSDTIDEIQGSEPSDDPDDAPMVLLECHMDLTLAEDPLAPEEVGYDLPYIITVNERDGAVVRVSRNWEKDDPNHRKQTYFVDYKFLPGLGFYGFGFYHAIGGLDAAATGSLRALLDAAAFANLQGGFKLKGRVGTGDIHINPGEFVDIDSPVDDVHKAVMALPFKEPSAALFQLLGFLVDTGRKFAATTDLNVADANPNAPVGTTLALLEEGSRVFSSIHVRLWAAQRLELKLLARLNHEYLDDQYPFLVKGGKKFALREDFDPATIDIVPVSDPNLFSSTQRIAQAQAMMQLAQGAPDLHDQRKVLVRVYEALRIPNYENVLTAEKEPVRLDAVSENVSLMRGWPIRAYEDQNHTAHIAVLDQWFNSLPPPAQQMFMGAYVDHRSEHMAYLYRVNVQRALGLPMTPLPNLKDPEAQMAEMDPRNDYLVSQASAQIVNQLPQQLAPMEGVEGGGETSEAEKLMQIEAQAIQVRAQADVEAKMMKAQADAEIKTQTAQLELNMKMKEAEADLTLEQQKAQIDANARAQEAQFDMNLEQQKLIAEIEKMKMKALAEIEIARQKAEAEISAKMITARTAGAPQ